MATTKTAYAARGDVMIHEELLAKIATPNEFFGVKYAPDWQSVALRAVVKLHKPLKIDANWCNCDNPYPCPTIRAIEKELN